MQYTENHRNVFGNINRAWSVKCGTFIRHVLTFFALSLSDLEWFVELSCHSGSGKCRRRNVQHLERNRTNMIFYQERNVTTENAPPTAGHSAQRQLPLPISDPQTRTVFRSAYYSSFYILGFQPVSFTRRKVIVKHQCLHACTHTIANS